jgi:signal transduction histidine kinase
LGLAPSAFLVALLNARLARASVGDLFVELRADPPPAELRGALARALRDPSLELVYWLSEFDTYADLDGRATALPGDGSGQATTLIDQGGMRVAALIHDPMLEDAVTAAAAIALENARLHVELRARLEELAGSRARVIEAGQKERQRFERDLHDGAQRPPDRAVARAEVARREAPWRPRRAHAAGGGTAGDHDVARGVAGARVWAPSGRPSGHGLAVALEQVAARASVPVRMSVRVDSRLPEPVEVAAYYVVTESLTNVAKHARATMARVEVDRADEALVVEVVDDGVGGAGSEGGTGLRGLADRVEALGGRLRVWTPRGGGTRVRAEIPCG